MGYTGRKTTLGVRLRANAMTCISFCVSPTQPSCCSCTAVWTALTRCWWVQDIDVGLHKSLSLLLDALLDEMQVGNGDVVDVASAHALLQEAGCHGIMVGRGAVQVRHEH